MCSVSQTSDSCNSSAIDWPRFVKLIKQHRRFLLTTHVRPDCDAFGSMLAMASILECLGKEVLLVNGFEVPPNLRFLDPRSKIKQLGVDISLEQLDDVEIMMVLDTSAWAQLGHIEELLRTTKAKKMVLDHHISSDDLGAEEFRNNKAEATGRLVLDAADQLGVSLTTEMAHSLFAAIATDTGWFRFPSTRSDTYRAVARLLDAGVVPQTVYSEIYEHDSLAKLQLIGRALERTRTEENGTIIYTSLTRKDFEDTGALPSETENIINMTLRVEEAQVAAIFVEQPEGKVKISLRSRCHVDCSHLAGLFGGGGHRAAAGATVSQPLGVICPQVLDAIRTAMR